MATASPGASSSALNVRPIPGLARSVSKYPDEMISLSTCLTDHPGRRHRPSEPDDAVRPSLARRVQEEQVIRLHEWERSQHRRVNG